MRLAGLLLFGGGRPERSDWNMNLRLGSEEAAGVRQIRAEGEIRTVEESGDLEGFAEILGPRRYRQKILLDLEDAPHIDSSGVSWLVHFHNSSRAAGGMLILHSVPPAVMAVLKLLGMHRYFNLVADLRAARAVALGGEP
jgi:anti-anti-sigma factor